MIKETVREIFDQERKKAGKQPVDSSADQPVAASGTQPVVTSVDRPVVTSSDQPDGTSDTQPVAASGVRPVVTSVDLLVGTPGDQPGATTGDEQGGKSGDDDCDKRIASLKDLVLKGIEGAVKKYRANTANRIAYETSLGGFIIEQIPYASWDDLDFPGLPLDPNGENPWVRRSGVLADHNALDPLPEDKPIPGGIIVNFSYVDWPELQDSRAQNPGELPTPEAFIKPTDADVTLKTTPVPPRTRYYPHNIVKAVRVRYTVFDRRYRKSSDNAAEKGRDKQIGYILVLYSGSDSH